MSKSSYLMAGALATAGAGCNTDTNARRAENAKNVRELLNSSKEIIIEYKGPNTFRGFRKIYYDADGDNKTVEQYVEKDAPGRILRNMVIIGTAAKYGLVHDKETVQRAQMAHRDREYRTLLKYFQNNKSPSPRIRRK